MTDMTIKLPEDVRTIISTLEEAGFEAYAVGGCVRDLYLGRTPGDWDITTSARPEEIKQNFRRTVDTGIEHGTVTVLLGDHSYEVTTYRVDGAYKDLRHPEAVTFTASLEEDLKRRDFTINAMAFNDRTGVVDLFDGCGDLQRGLIRCVGDPDARFNEDALRILRAVRFSAQLDFAVEAATAAAVTRHAANLAAVSRERILTELTKLICSAHIERISDLFRLGLAPYMTELFPKVRDAHIMELKERASLPEMEDAWRFAAEASAWMQEEEDSESEAHVCLADPTEAVTEHEEKHAHGHVVEKLIPGPGSKEEASSSPETSSVSEGTSPPMKNIFALFGLPAPKPAEVSLGAGTGDDAVFISDTNSGRLRFSAYDLLAPADTDRRYIRFAFLLQGMEEADARRLMKSLKADNVTSRQATLLAARSLEPLPQDRYLLKKAMARTTPALFRDLLYIKLASAGTALYREQCAEEDIRAVIKLFEDIMYRGEPVYLTDLVMSGSDLISLGAAEGPEIGEILNRMLDAVQKDPQINTMMYLISNYYRLKK